ncbi:SRPBCC family protein [Nocardia sp. alder85J]|uniref:SRPBCC family protein n=1 Tax=Nocardia sp. alder85J TaxID=2862949 RepID=UPI001CD285EA|nr:SRPBCC family protein [Nocardia sp. alder85J]MCX4093714.1 SRPBCC family protein [Nocardia sp. alder85J]
MRTKTNHRFVVDVDPAVVTEALLAVERIPEWSPMHRDVRVATRDEYDRPQRVYATVSPTGTSDRQVLEYSYDGDRISWQVVESGAGGGGRGWFELTETEEGTEIWYHSEVYLPIPVPGILMKRSLSRLNEEAVHNLAEFIEKFRFDANYELH